MVACMNEPSRGTLELISDSNASADDLRQRLELLHEEIEAAFWKRGLPWSSVPLVRYVADEIIYLEEAMRVVSLRCPAEDFVPALSLLGLEVILDELPKKIGSAVARRALVERDALWWGRAVYNRNYGDKKMSPDDLPPPYSWNEYSRESRHPCGVGPYRPWPKKSGAPRPWFSMRLLPGNVPNHHEIHAPAVPLEGLGWNGSIEVAVTREMASRKSQLNEEQPLLTLTDGADWNFFDEPSAEKEPFVDGTSRFKDPYPDARIWLVKEKWVDSRTQPQAEPSNICMTFCGQSTQDVVVMGQHRWWLELCVAVVLARGDVLSRRERQQVVEDLATKMRGRVDEHGLSDEDSARLARSIAQKMLHHLVENFRRPLYSKSLGGTFKHGVRGKRLVTGAHPSATGAQRRSVGRDGVEDAADLDADSPEDVTHLLRLCQRVLAALSIEVPFDIPEIVARSGLEIGDVETALSTLDYVGEILGNAKDGYRRSE